MERWEIPYKNVKNLDGKEIVNLSKAELKASIDDVRNLLTSLRIYYEFKFEFEK